jgi:membrane protease YdiL (CAAX protease family)
MVRFWNSIPVVIRAVVAGYVVNIIGGLPGLFLFANLKFFPQFPWSLPAMILWLSIFWWYFNGGGPPRSTSEARHNDLRAAPVPRILWKWSLVAGSLALISLVGIGFLTPRLAEIPSNDFKISEDFTKYPWWTILSALILISVTAGVAEEAGYRGYMLSPIQRRHGWTVAALITGFVFFLDHHFSHAYATFAFLPFFMLVSAVHALLVRFTRSIRPSVVLHTLFDLLVIPVQYGLIGQFPVTSVFKTGVDKTFLAEIGIAVVFGLAAWFAFWKLARLERRGGEV